MNKDKRARLKAIMNQNKELFEKFAAQDKCQQCKRTGTELHECPYSEISLDDTLCNCCELCQYDCAMEV